jgi:MFS family permease
VITALVVLVSALGTFLFSKFAHLVRLHKVLFVTILAFALTTLTIPLFVNHPDHLYRAYALGAVYGLIFGFYWTCQYAALVQLLPKHKMGKYTGLFPAAKNIANAFGPTIYAVIAQWQNNQMLAISLSIVPFSLLSLVPLALTDFAAGAKQVEAEEELVRRQVHENQDTESPNKYEVRESQDDIVPPPSVHGQKIVFTAPVC